MTHGIFAIAIAYQILQKHLLALLIINMYITIHGNIS
jgi:hypothetical protein